MEFSIYFENSSGYKCYNKQTFLQELSKIIIDCENNGGTTFSIEVTADAPCCWIDEEKKEVDISEVIEGVRKLKDFCSNYKQCYDCPMNEITDGACTIAELPEFS